MYIIEHAFLNLLKNKGRNILLGVIIFAIITSIVIALSIYNTTEIIIDETRASLQCAVRITPQKQASGGRQQITASSEQTPSISMDEYLHFAESKYLDGADIKESGRSVDGVDAVYYLKHPDMLSSFEIELRNKGLPDGYGVINDESAFNTVVEPIDSLNKLSLTFLSIVLILGAVIIMLLSSISIRERKYEIGVLRAMGMKKKQVALGLWVEIIAITCICFVLGMGTGAALSQPISDAIMIGQTKAPALGSTSLADRLNAETDVIEQTTRVDVSVSSITAMEIFVVSILLASIAGMISISRITKYEPIKILMEQN